MADRKEIEDLVLKTLDEQGPIPDSLDWLKSLQREADHDRLIGVLQSLLGFEFVTLKSTDHATVTLTNEGQTYARDGSPEGQVYKCIPESGVIAQAEIEQIVGKDTFKIGLAQCMSKRWIEFEDKKAGTLKRKVPNASDEVQEQLQAVVNHKIDIIDKVAFENLKKRKLVATSSYKTFAVAKGTKYQRVRKAQATDLTVEMLKGDKWKSEDFKEYNIHAIPESISAGCLHPLLKVREQFRNILLEMGFSEMPTNNYVESSFWNFDTLFQPQQHPARDSHDTFFLTAPEKTLDIPEAYKQRVQDMHEHGGHGSIGYRYDWKLEEAQKNILRTHTTAVSSRMLYALAQGPFEPKKYFSIDRVFRNETLDATHLAEFHQVEGLIADRNLTLGDLIGTIHTFFKRIGISDVKFKPAYNPYTEPSMEIFGYSEQLKKWIEVGNSGIFRPEMLKPMGLPDDVRVIAWGLSLERPTMIKYGIKNIRDLFGPKVKLNIIQKNPIARFD